MATKINLVKNKTAKNGYVGFSWMTLFLGPIEALRREDYLWAAIMAAAFVLTSGFSMIAFPFFYNKFHLKKLIEKDGYIPADKFSEKILQNQDFLTASYSSHSAQRKTNFNSSYEPHPEDIFNEEIEKQKQIREALKKGLIEIEFHKKPLIQDIDKRKDDLKKIQILIKKAQDEGNLENELKGVTLLAEREREYNNIIATLNNISEKEVEILNSIKLVDKQIKELQSEKDTKIAEFNLAKAREKIIDITGNLKDVENSSKKSFEAAKNKINDRIKRVETMESVNKKMNNQTTDDPFEGL